MKFLKYLQEEVIKSNIGLVKTIIKKVDEIVKNFIRNNINGDISYNDIRNWKRLWMLPEEIYFSFYIDHWYDNRSSKFIINGIASSTGKIEIVLSLEFANFIKSIVNSKPSIDRMTLDKTITKLFDEIITENRLLGKEKCSTEIEQKIVDQIRDKFKLKDKNLVKKQHNLFDKRKKDITTSVPWDEIREYVKKNDLVVSLASIDKKIENLEEDTDYRDFINKHLPNTLRHELIHREQFNRAKKITPGIGIKKKDIKKYGRNVYFHDRIEQMAHADGMLKQLKDAGYDNETIGKMLKQPEKYSDELMKSRSYRDFREVITDEKHWKQFMKYVYQYWVDKEEK